MDQPSTLNPFVIEVNHVSFAFRSSPVLSDINLSIAQGEFIGIFGPNGGGKTTFLKLIMGFLTPDRGTIRIFQQPPEKTRHRIGYVPQIHRTEIDFPITVAELIAMGRLSRRPFFGGFCKDDWIECEAWMERLGLAQHKNKAYGELSGGLAQRALLARALISNPDILILDEPTAHIDSDSVAIFFETIGELKGSKTIFLVTHDLKTVIQRTSRLLCVQRKISTYLPHEICEHFNLGLYHPPLTNQLSQFASHLP
jgi:zinc transport system ATP-binding protein